MQVLDIGQVDEHLAQALAVEGEGPDGRGHLQGPVDVPVAHLEGSGHPGQQGLRGSRRQALQQAREVLDAHFNADNPNSRALRARIDELTEQPIAVTPPDLSPTLNAVQAYIQAKQTARNQQQSDVEPAAAPADDIEATLQEAPQ